MVYFFLRISHAILESVFKRSYMAWLKIGFVLRERTSPRVSISTSTNRRLTCPRLPRGCQQQQLTQRLPRFISLCYFSTFSLPYFWWNTVVSLIGRGWRRAWGKICHHIPHNYWIQVSEMFSYLARKRFNYLRCLSQRVIKSYDSASKPSRHCFEQHTNHVTSTQLMLNIMAFQS